MRELFFIILFLSINISFAQNFSNKEINRLNSFGVILNNIDLNDQKSYLDLEKILEKEKKRRTNKFFGIALTSLSALTTTFGGIVIANSKDDQEGVGQSVGAMFVVIGIAELGISIPLFISTKKRKKERNKLIEKYDQNQK